MVFLLWRGGEGNSECRVQNAEIGYGPFGPRSAEQSMGKVLRVNKVLTEPVTRNPGLLCSRYSYRSESTGFFIAERAE